MQVSRIVYLFSFSIFPLFCLDQSLQCDPLMQYSKETMSGQRCCDKCKPGQYLEKDCETEFKHPKCKDCPPGFYMDEFTSERNCYPCSDCTMMNMVCIENCTPTRNSVCGCKPGYHCKSTPCSDCELITTEASDTTPKDAYPWQPVVSTDPPFPDREAKFLLCACVVCVCVSVFLIAVSFASRCHLRKWRADGFWIYKNTFQNEKMEEDAQTPVQEMCGKLDILDNEYC